MVSAQKEKVKVLVGHGPEGEIFARTIEATDKNNLLPHLVLFMERVGKRNPYLQVRPDGEVPLEKLVGDAVAQVKREAEHQKSSGT